MNFFESQDHARRATRRLVVLFALAVAAITVAVYFAVLVIFVFGREKYGIGEPFSLWRPQVFIGVAVATLSVIAAGSIYKTRELSDGGETVALLMGGKLVSSSTTDAAQRRLLNVVEEMAIASGTAVPSVYILERESGINAFAAGFNSNDAVVGVTRGCLDLLTRDELQGVIAHEFSHVLNGDMRLNLRLIGLLHGILVIAIIGSQALRFRGSSRGGKKGGNAGALIAFGVALWIIGYIGVFFGKLIKSAVSRQRELLGDAAAVQFTRNPSSIAGALKKIGGHSGGSRVRDLHAEEASHMFFGNALGKSWLSMLATHPPLEERIRRIEPGFDGTYPKVEAPAALLEKTPAALLGKSASGAAMAPDVALGYAALGALAAQAALSGAARGTGVSPSQTAPLAPRSIAESVGRPTPDHLAYAANLLARLPASLVAEVREPGAAVAAVYALLLAGEPHLEARAAQLESLESSRDPRARAETERLAPLVGQCPEEGRLALVDLALPALRRLSEDQYGDFLATVRRLADADRAMSLFEYTLQRILKRHLDPHFGRSKPPRVQYYSLVRLRDEVSVIVSLLAHFGDPDAAAAQAAFARAAAALEPTGVRLVLQPSGESDFTAVHRALTGLEEVSPQLKRQLLEACAAAVSHDGRVTIAEGELLRAVADSLDCPMPPLLPGLGMA